MSRLRPLALVLVLALPGCGGGGSDLPVLPKDAVQTQVEQYAGITLAASGAGTFSESAANVTGCPRDNGRGLSDPDEEYYVQGIYRLPVAAAQLTATLDKIRDEWQRNGYTLASAASPTEVSATTNDNYRFDLTAEQGLRLSIASPCYRPKS
ncbi:hypothetical protein ODJ79_01750 [Actinoplanes sp. KI2]|uniref:hypothetical protein n=1 Tax=Actinoplanes sp. KI2 TaxID=2983315 RepID=UPI0021D60C2A|nr:hypothetical protein [Actinoplanes sp. KI2]MCU7722429.1 hypothetical protein [Actinoplanes sp. KI2]